MRRSRSQTFLRQLQAGGDLAAGDAEGQSRRGRPSCRAWRPAIRPAGHRSISVLRSLEHYNSLGAAASAEQPRADPLACWRGGRNCLRSPASIRHFIAATTPLPTTMPFPSISTRRRPPLRLPWPVVRICCRAAARGCAGRRATGASSSRISAAALRCARCPDGRSVESTMGFTALDGLPMGTRPGQIDPGVVLYLLTMKE